MDDSGGHNWSSSQTSVGRTVVGAISLAWYRESQEDEESWTGISVQEVDLSGPEPASSPGSGCESCASGVR